MQAKLATFGPLVLLIGSLSLTGKSPGMASIGLCFGDDQQRGPERSRLWKQIAVFAALRVLLPEVWIKLKQRILSRVPRGTGGCQAVASRQYTSIMDSVMSVASLVNMVSTGFRSISKLYSCSRYYRSGSHLPGIVNKSWLTL
jgi:hypothetical protein